MRAAVIGLGAMGSAALWQLAQEGVDVTGFEQFFPGHSLGSSHGESRIIRQAYFEDPQYVPLVLRAYELWAELEQRSGRGVLVPTGGLMLGAAESEVVSGALLSAREHGLRHELLDAAEIHRRFPAFHPDSDWFGVHEPDAGALRPELAIATAVEAARSLGAKVNLGVQVAGLDEHPGGVTVRTTEGDLEVDRAIIAAGAWNPEFAQFAAVPLAVERQVPVWFTPADPAPFAVGRFPVYLVEAQGIQYYGFPSMDGRTVKAARHHEGTLTRAAEIDRVATPEDLDVVRDFAAHYLPGLGRRVTQAVVCMYTNTPDRHFAVGYAPGSERIVLLGGFSGHGFKFAPAVGEAAKDLLLQGEARLRLDLFRPGRFQGA